MSANTEAIEAWNGVLFDKFVRFREVATTGLGNHGAEGILRHPPQEGARVLDVGCGFGDTTIRLAQLVGPRGSAVGVDGASRFVEAARGDAEKLRIENVQFLEADVQSGELGGPYDYAYSRMGTMFFASPVAAMKNIRRSLTAGGKLCIVVWRKREDNEWVHIAEKVVRSLIPPEEETHNQPTCGPGPFSMAGADMVSDILQAAGWSRVGFERNDAPICIGRTIDEAVEFAMALGPAGQIIRLAGKEGEAKRPQIIEGLRSAFEAYLGPNGVRAPSSAWIVTATA